MGLDPQVDVQTVTMAPDAPNSVWTGTVRNIVARLEGAGPDADQACCSPRTTTPYPDRGRGGGQRCGSGQRPGRHARLASGPAPRHDVIAAFVDGEEHEMLGSLALVESAGWLVTSGSPSTPKASATRAGHPRPDQPRQRVGPGPVPAGGAVAGGVLGVRRAAQRHPSGRRPGRYQDVVPAGLELVVSVVFPLTTPAPTPRRHARRDVGRVRRHGGSPRRAAGRC